MSLTLLYLFLTIFLASLASLYMVSEAIKNKNYIEAVGSMNVLIIISIIANMSQRAVDAVILFIHNRNQHRKVIKCNDWRPFTIEQIPYYPSFYA